MPYYINLIEKIKEKESFKINNLQIKRHAKKTGTYACFLQLN